MSSRRPTPAPISAARRRWWIALTVAAIWHVGVGGMLEVWQPWRAAPGQAEEFEPLDIVFASPPPVRSTAAEEERPREFTELPENRADLAPDDPDFISNVDSRARDRATEGEETEMPRLEGESEAPHVGLAPPEEVPPAEPGSGSPEAESPEGDPREEDATSLLVDEAEGDRPRTQTPDDGDAGRRGPEEQRLRDQVLGRQGRSPIGEDRSGFTPNSSPPRHRVGPAVSDILQEEMKNPAGNVPLFGDVSMNTVAWPWAPWLQRFARDFLRGWSNFVPYAYHIGVVHGRQVVELEISREGKLLHMEVRDREGHQSLEDATLANFRSFAPYHPLSSDGSFPEETLRLRVTVIYPDH